jgi:hypothetical protein
MASSKIENFMESNASIHKSNQNTSKNLTEVGMSNEGDENFD